MYQSKNLRPNDLSTHGESQALVCSGSIHCTGGPRFAKVLSQLKRFARSRQQRYGPILPRCTLTAGFLAGFWRLAAGENKFSKLAIEEGTTYLLNPGSIGQPRDGDTRAAFAIADLDNNAVEFWRIPYDLEPVQKRMSAAGLPEALILRLSFGR